MKYVLEKDTHLRTHRRIPVLLAKKLQEAIDCLKQQIFNRQRNEERKNVRAALVKHMYMLCKRGRTETSKSEMALFGQGP